MLGNGPIQVDASVTLDIAVNINKLCFAILRMSNDFETISPSSKTSNKIDQCESQQLLHTLPFKF